MNNARYEKRAVYVIIAINYLASKMVDRGVLVAWPGGFRRLNNIQADTIRKYTSLYGRTDFKLY